MTLASDLRAVRAVIDTPEKWTKGAFARKVNGDPGSYSEAVCFCILGAIRVALSNNRFLRTDLRNHLRVALPNPIEHDALDDFNDAPSTTHADVMALFDVAIKKAEEERNEV